MTIYSVRSTNTNGVDSDIQIDSSDFSVGGGTSAEEKAIAQLVIDVNLWRLDATMLAPIPPPI